MCGIIGIASISHIPVNKRSWLHQGINAMYHRGPDDIGEWWAEDGCIGLSHRRLSIIDLSPAGHQPMKNTGGKVLIVFNGEIYNYKELRKELVGKGYCFNSNTDTEVIMAAYSEWGTACLTHLNGMFAFAIYDRNLRQLFLARDRAGEKPLFYYLKNGSLRFASELKGLMADSSINKRINISALDCLLAMGFIPGQMCILEDFNKLPPAHALIFQLSTGALKTWKYWDLPALKLKENEKVNEDELLDELEFLLEDSVRRQLVADVPVGILLSGGVDSSLVTAMAVRATSKVKTFTVSFPGHSKFDESCHARLIANYFQTEHTELAASEVSVDLLPVLARQFDEPMIDSSMIPTYLVSQLIRQHCTVALGGDGGDELFGGYGHHSRLIWMYSKMRRIPEFFRNPVSKVGSLLPVGFKGKIWLQNLGNDMDKGLPLIASVFDSKTRKQLMTKINSWELVAESIRKKRIPENDDLLQRITRMDFLNYLPEDILVKIDRASMLNSLEVRAPLLDYRLIEFAYSKVPSYLKATSTTRKVLLKKLTSRLLPSEFDQQRKQGFGIPLGEWLQSGSWKDFFYDVLIGSEDTFFNRKVLAKLLHGQAKGRNNTERLFGLTMFELWRKEYKVSI